MREMAILTDVTRCIGCQECVVQCKKVNGLEKTTPYRWSAGDGLDANTWTTVVVPAGTTRYVRRQCRHCLEPACASVCPVGALEKTDEGPVTYNPDICMGCRYCMLACPYGIPRYAWSEPIPYVQKCSLCYERIQSGESRQPACTEACPVEATIFGERTALLKEARRRIAAEPHRYLPRIWGEKEVGGSSVLYLSDVNLSFLGWSHNLGEDPLPARTWGALSAVPYEAAGMGAAMTGLWWVIQRRDKLRRLDAKSGDGPRNDQNDKGDPR